MKTWEMPVCGNYFLADVQPDKDDITAPYVYQQWTGVNGEASISVEGHSALQTHPPVYSWTASTSILQALELGGTAYVSPSK